MIKKIRFKVCHRENRLMAQLKKIKFFKVNIKIWKALFSIQNKMFTKNLIIKKILKETTSKIFQVRIIYKFHLRNQLFIKIAFKLKAKTILKIKLIKSKA